MKHNFIMNSVIFVAFSLLQLVYTAEIYSHAELHFNEGTYKNLNEELREWLESEKDTIK